MNIFKNIRKTQREINRGDIHIEDIATEGVVKKIYFTDEEKDSVTTEVEYFSWNSELSAYELKRELFTIVSDDFDERYTVYKRK